MEGLATRVQTHNKKLYLRERHFYVLKKNVENIKQDEKHIPDLLEWIMKPSACKRRVTKDFVQNASI